MKKLTVLIADDVAEIRALLARFLEIFDVEVVDAEDGVRALEVAEAERPSVVFIDVQMPGGGAVEHVATLRSMLPDARIVAMSAMAPPTVQHQLIRLGADVFLDKRDLSLAIPAVLGFE